MKYFIVKYHYTIKGTATNRMDSEQVIDEILVTAKTGISALIKVKKNIDCMVLGIKEIKILK